MMIVKGTAYGRAYSRSESEVASESDSELLALLIESLPPVAELEELAFDSAEELLSERERWRRRLPAVGEDGGVDSGRGCGSGSWAWLTGYDGGPVAACWGASVGATGSVGGGVLPFFGDLPSSDERRFLEGGDPSSALELRFGAVPLGCSDPLGLLLTACWVCC